MECLGYMSITMFHHKLRWAFESLPSECLQQLRPLQTIHSVSQMFKKKTPQTECLWASITPKGVLLFKRNGVFLGRLEFMLNLDPLSEPSCSDACEWTFWFYPVGSFQPPGRGNVGGVGVVLVLVCGEVLLLYVPPVCWWEEEAEEFGRVDHPPFRGTNKLGQPYNLQSRHN